MNCRNIIRYVLSFKNLVNNCLVDINDIKNLPNVFLRRISEIVIMTNHTRLHTFLKHAGYPRGEVITKFGQLRTRREGGKRSNIVPDILCEWPLSKIYKYNRFECSLKTDSINFSFDKEPENRKRTFLTRHCAVGFLLSVIQNNSVSKLCQIFSNFNTR